MNNKVRIYGSGHGSLVVSLTKYFKRLKLKRGDNLYVYIKNNKIILSKSEININDLRPEIISKPLWDSFEKVLFANYGRKGLEYSTVKEKLEDAIKLWIKKKTSFLEKTIVKF